MYTFSYIFDINHKTTLKFCITSSYSSILIHNTIDCSCRMHESLVVCMNLSMCLCGLAARLMDYPSCKICRAVTLYAAFRLACLSPHCHFDEYICTTVHALLAADGWPSGKQRLANRSITLPLCPPQTVKFYSTRKRCCSVVKPKRPKQQAMITWRSSDAAS